MRSSALPLGSRLDRYVARLFALSYGAAFFLVVGLFVIIDMTTKLDGYLAPDKNGYTPPSTMVGEYYLLQLPFLYMQMSPYVTLVAGMFTAAKLARSNEIVAGLNAGVSVRRILLPVYLGATLLALGMFVLREQSTRGLGRKRDLLQDHLEVHLDEHRPAPVLENLVVRDLRGRALRLGQYTVALDPQASEFRDLSLLLHEKESSIILSATAGRPLSGGRWQLTEGRRIEDDNQERRTRSLPVLDDPRFTPEDVERAWKARDHPMDLSYAELSDLGAREPTNLQYRTLLQYNLTFPLAGLVLLLVGLPFVVGDERGKAGERIARGFLLCVGYFGIDFIARTLGLQGAVGPIFSGWLPVVLFGSLGTVLTAAMRS